MKIKTAFVLLTIAALLVFSGCSQTAARENLNNTGYVMQSGADIAEDAARDAAVGIVSTTPAVSQEEVAGTVSTVSAISKEEAENIALSHAGFMADQVSWLHTEYEVDNGKPQYEVDFHQDRWEYEYEIHAETGEILSYDRDD